VTQPLNEAEVLAWRKQARTTLIEWRQALAPDEHESISHGAFRWVEDVFLQHLKTLTVGMYFPFKRELNPLPFAEKLIAAGGQVAMPVVTARDAPLKFRAWAPGDPVAKGVWDIPYPAEGPWVEPDALIIALVGFDSAGYRLGYGGGYYDRTLDRYRKPMTIGVGFEETRVETIHPLPHDVPLDSIVTEDGVFQRAEEAV
jgi:5-formyltetrahydrofolate cyclo-ligase